jgi:FtsP/CotA-like multicopper oxidase with cupredoxin domain
MIKTSLNLILAAFSFIAFATTLNAQSTPPPLMFSEMNGTKLLDNGMEVPIWGYGLSADGFITVPGPLLQYETGDQVNLAFTNPSPESHTIHLHGLDVDQANDGVPTTSFMVVTGQVGEYAFTAPHPGTYLYHCHVTTTLHLTMGMYGMILVRHPDGILYDGGSTYHSDAPLLFSDLEIETNLTSVQSFPFHDIRPDYFMVNGLSGTQLEDGTQILSCPYGEQLALRLGSMAYTRVKVILPEEWNPTCLMTDGRPLPESFSATELDIYPGERFTVLITPPVPDYDGTFEVQYWDMVSGDYESSNYVRFRDASLDIEDAPAPDTFTAYPNPAQNQIRISSAGPWVITDITGREIMNGSDSNIDVSSLPQGKYTIRGTDLDRGITFVIQR